MKPDYTSSLGYRLYTIRKKRGYTQREIAKHINVSAQAYSQYESNARTPNLITLSQIANFLNVTTDFLINGRPIHDIIIDTYLSEEVNQLPEEGVTELKNYVDYLLHKYSDR